MVFESLRKLSLNELIASLHEALEGFKKDIDVLTEKNRELDLEEINKLRDHIKDRLTNNKEAVENARLLKLIDLFKEDKEALDVIKIDLNDWLEFLEAMKLHVQNKQEDLSGKELKELEKIEKDITNLQRTLRKD